MKEPKRNFLEAYGLAVAWEQVAYWRASELTLAEAGRAIGLPSPTSWVHVARVLARKWTVMKEDEFIKFISGKAA